MQSRPPIRLFRARYLPSTVEFIDRADDICLPQQPFYRMKYIITLFVIVCIQIPIFCFGQDSVAVGAKKGKDRKVSFAVLPAIASNPSNGFMFGVTGVAGWYMGDRQTTTLSNAVGAVIYTTKKQSINFIKSDLFLRNDRWMLKGDWRLFFSTEKTYGLGSGPLADKPVPFEQQVDFDLIRFHETAMMRLGTSRFFAGVGYHLDLHRHINDVFSVQVPDSVTATSNDSYSLQHGFNTEQYKSSGISLNALFDSRNNPVFPAEGNYAFASLRLNEQWLGSDKGASTLWLEYRHYFSLSHQSSRHIIALWTYANLLTSGVTPYLDLPAVGWDTYGRSARGYKQGQIRGHDLLYAELEWRFPLPVVFRRWPDLLGGVLFANASTASDTDTGLSLFAAIDPAAGIGLRIMLSQQSKTNLTIDYAFGAYGSSGLYLDFNEAF